MMKLKPLYTAVTLAAFSGMLLSPLVHAARVGSGKSSGMQRSAPSKSYSSTPARSTAPTPAYRPAPQAAAPVQAPARSGPGIGTAVAAGVAGAAAGYMLSSAINSPSQPVAAAQQAAGQAAGTAQQAANTVQQGVAAPLQQAAGVAAPVAGAVAAGGVVAAAPQAVMPATTTQQQAQALGEEKKSGGTPWGMIFLLAAVLIGGYLFMRRRTSTPAAQPIGAPLQRTPLGHQNDATYARTFDAPPSAQPMLNGGQAVSSYAANDRLADGTEVIHFLRAAKGYFNNLQTLNSPESAEEARKYMTPALFNELRHEISSNRDIAEFEKLEAQVIESTMENNQYVASVEFSGFVSESVGAPMVPFTETWHFVKETHSPSAKWLLAGIQQ